MKKELNELIDDELNNINTTLEDIYNTDIEKNITKKINEQNDYALKVEKERQKIIKILKEKQEMNNSIEFSENMSLKELEEILEKTN